MSLEIYLLMAGEANIFMKERLGSKNQKVFFR